MIMGEEFTSKVFQNLDESEVKIIGEHMAQIQKVDPKMVAAILQEFVQRLQEQQGDGDQREGVSREDASAWRSIPGRPTTSWRTSSPTAGPGPSRKLASLSPQVLASLLASEHPQTIALLLVHMKYQNAAEVIRPSRNRSRARWS